MRRNGWRRPCTAQPGSATSGQGPARPVVGAPGPAGPRLSRVPALPSDDDPLDRRGDGHGPPPSSADGSSLHSDERGVSGPTGPDASAERPRHAPRPAPVEPVAPNAGHRVSRADGRTVPAGTPRKAAPVSSTGPRSVGEADAAPAAALCAPDGSAACRRSTPPPPPYGSTPGRAAASPPVSGDGREKHGCRAPPLSFTDCASPVPCATTCGPPLRPPQPGRDRPVECPGPQTSAARAPPPQSTSTVISGGIRRVLCTVQWSTTARRASCRAWLNRTGSRIRRRTAATRAGRSSAMSYSVLTCSWS